jgi:hypothetical protein
MEQQNDLSKLDLKQLGELKDRWLEEAATEKKFEKLNLIAGTLGELAEGDSWYRLKMGNITVSAPDRTSSSTVEVMIGDKMVAQNNKQDNYLFIPGVWEAMVFPLYEDALAKIDRANKEAAEQQRLELIKELTLPPLTSAQAG